MITLFDIPSTLPKKAWSPNVWKTRIVLNHKSLPHKTEWVEFADIEAVCKKHGAPPTMKNPDGTDYYSVPFIVDSFTNTVVADSYEIALYLDKTYPAPEYKPIFPDPNGHVAYYAFEKGFRKFFPEYLMLLSYADTVPVLSAPSAEYYSAKFVSTLGPADQVAPMCSSKRERIWARVRKGFEEFSAPFDRNGGEAGSLFVMGDALSYPDVIVASWLLWAKLVLPDKDWERVQALNGGRWGRFMKEFERYEIVF